MARIRTIKPEFFRHEALQDLEIANPGMYPMMVFEGLWGHCDSKGRFEWRPRQLKLDILPFLPFDMAETLEILSKAGMVKRYAIGEKEYGEIPSFEKHQRLSGKESQDGEKHPAPTQEATGKQQGSNREIPESQEGKGREKEGEEEGNGVDAVPPCSTDAPPTASPKPKSSSTGTRLPDDWVLPKAWGEWALVERNDLTADDVRREAACFADYWRGKAGADARKADWEATWRNWIRRSDAAGGRGKAARPAAKGPPPRDNFDQINYGPGGRL